MNPKNLEGKSLAYQKDAYEIELISDYEMEYGFEGNWTEEVVKEFDRRGWIWDHDDYAYSRQKARVFRHGMNVVILFNNTFIMH